MSLPIPSFNEIFQAAKKNQLVVALVIMIIFAVYFANNWHDSSDIQHADNKQSMEYWQKAYYDERAAHKADNDKNAATILSISNELKQVRLDQDAERKMLLNKILDPGSAKKGKKK